MSGSVPTSSLTSLPKPANPFAASPSSVPPSTAVADTSSATQPEVTPSAASTHLTPSEAFLLSMGLPDFTPTSNPSEGKEATEGSGSGSTPDKRSHANDEQADGGNGNASPSKKAKLVDLSYEPMVPIQCITCCENNNPASVQCWNCKRDPRAMLSASPAPASAFACPSPSPAAVVSVSAAPSLSAALAAEVGAAASALSAGAGAGAVGFVSSGQSWVKQGTTLPLIPEAKEAMQKGIYKETRFYLPQPVSLHTITSNHSKLDIELQDGKLVAKSSHVTGRITTFDDLRRAHHDGIIPCLTELADFHRINEYTLLWSFVTHLQEMGVSMDIMFRFYEAMRMNHPGVKDRVGQQDPLVFGQLAINLAARPFAGHASSSSSSSSARVAAGSGAGSGRQKVCIGFNDLKCTSTPCPKGLPHLCCRCFGAHAANSGTCSLPDPRKSRDGGSRRGGKGGSGSKPTPSSSQ
jgi:hypothetical protein